VSAGSTRGRHDALALSLDVSAVPSQPVGAGRYTIDLARALGARDDVDLTLWCRRGDRPRWSAVGTGLGAGVGTGARTRVGTGAGATVRAVAPARRPARLVWEQVRLPSLLTGGSVDVHHGPHYTMPERARVPRVVTIHDLTFLDHPEWHERSKVTVFRRAIRVAARRAEAIVCVSRHTAERLDALCAPTGRVFVVPHGVDHERFGPEEPTVPGPGKRATASDDEVLRQLGVVAPYVLFLGTLEPRKAVPDLVAAFDRVAADDKDLSLVLAGRPGWGTEAVERAISGARFGSRVVRIGYVPDQAVPALLRRAAAVAYPALEEGFGLPALEALACGAPLVTTTGTAMAEVAGGAAMLVAPGSVPELADALGDVLGAGQSVEERRRLGLEVAAAHTWEVSAAGHLSVYRWAATRAGSWPPGPRAAPR
jgi:glycosyltransferase involved in cell wall biosynthesis